MPVTVLTQEDSRRTQGEIDPSRSRWAQVDDLDSRVQISNTNDFILKAVCGQIDFHTQVTATTLLNEQISHSLFFGTGNSFAQPFSALLGVHPYLEIDRVLKREPHEVKDLADRIEKEGYAILQPPHELFEHLETYESDEDILPEEPMSLLARAISQRVTIEPNNKEADLKPLNLERTMQWNGPNNVGYLVRCESVYLPETLIPDESESIQQGWPTATPFGAVVAVSIQDFPISASSHTKNATVLFYSTGEEVFYRVAGQDNAGDVHFSTLKPLTITAARILALATRTDSKGNLPLQEYLSHPQIPPSPVVQHLRAYPQISNVLSQHHNVNQNQLPNRIYATSEAGLANQLHELLKHGDKVVTRNGNNAITVSDAMRYFLFYPENLFENRPFLNLIDISRVLRNLVELSTPGHTLTQEQKSLIRFLFRAYMSEQILKKQTRQRYQDLEDSMLAEAHKSSAPPRGSAETPVLNLVALRREQGPNDSTQDTTTPHTRQQAARVDTAQGSEILHSLWKAGIPNDKKSKPETLEEQQQPELQHRPELPDGFSRDTGENEGVEEPVEEPEVAKPARYYNNNQTLFRALSEMICHSIPNSVVHAYEGTKKLVHRGAIFITSGLVLAATSLISHHTLGTPPYASIVIDHAGHGIYGAIWGTKLNVTNERINSIVSQPTAHEQVLDLQNLDTLPQTKYIIYADTPDAGLTPIGDIDWSHPDNETETKYGIKKTPGNIATAILANADSQLVRDIFSAGYPLHSPFYRKEVVLQRAGTNGELQLPLIAATIKKDKHGKIYIVGAYEKSGKNPNPGQIHIWDLSNLSESLENFAVVMAPMDQAATDFRNDLK